MPNTRNTWEDVLRRIHVTDYGCWLWLGTCPSGYGQVWWDNKPHKTHRFMYERLVGPIPDGFQVDHLCRVTDCCNPAHLEAVTARENVRRSKSPTAANMAKTHCPKGHPYSGDNLYVRKNGARLCRECHRERWRKWNEKRRNRMAA